MSIVKINWGTRIALVYGGFVVLIAVLVTLSMKQDFQLVTPDYYGQEIKYQQVIDAGKNQAALSAPVRLHAGEASVTIDFPSEFSDKQMVGTVNFYAAAKAEWDQQFDLQAVNNSMTVSREKLRATRYTVKIRWKTAGKEYYQESAIDLSRSK